MNKDLKEQLQRVSTAAITTVLLKHGYRNNFVRGSKPISAHQPRVVGPAFTLRFIPVREDLVSGKSALGPINTRVAIEDMPEGVVVVADALGRTDAGIAGDVLCARMMKRGVAGLITDGAIRDLGGVLETSLPVWSSGVAAPPPQASLSFVAWQEPIGCGGAAVLPGDIVVADADGAVVIPDYLAEQVADEASEVEEVDLWVLSEVDRGVPLPGLYPMNAETKARYDQRGRASP